MSEIASHLSAAQANVFWQDGCIVAEHAVSEKLLAALSSSLSGWLAESGFHTGAFDKTIDGRAGFDVAASHSKTAPALRRVDNPPEIDGDFAEAAFDSPMVDMVNDLIGPNLKFHHAKVKLKQPGTKTASIGTRVFPTRRTPTVM